MDINCGLVLDGELDVPQMGQRIFEHILRAASGEPTKSELLGPGRPRVRALAPGHRELSASSPDRNTPIAGTSCP